MKILSIGDVHGKNTWARFEDIPQLIAGNFIPKYDKYIFVGDYTDSFEQSNVEIRENLDNIIAFKEKYPENVILLWGNHDIQYYLGPSKYRCSGFRSEVFYDLNELFRNKKHLFQLSYQYNNYIWTHAGINNIFYEELIEYLEVKGIRIETNISETLNLLFDREDPIIFRVGHSRGGWYKAGGPLWSDHRDNVFDPLGGYHQIYGHSRQKNGINKTVHNQSSSLTCIDVLEDKRGYGSELYHTLII